MDNLDTIPDIKIKLESTPIEPKIRKMEFAKVPVCSKCGSAIFGNPEHPNPKCCGELMPLKRYIEEVRGEKFEEEKWEWKDETIYACSDEMKQLLNKEIKK